MTRQPHGPSIPFENLLNFRDVAQSINNATGNHPILKQGLFYRSARPDEATLTDRRRLLTDFKIRTIIDLCTPTEHLEQARKYAAATTSSSVPVPPEQPPQIPGIAYHAINLNGPPTPTR